MFIPRTGVALGPLAIATMQSIRVRMAILGAGGIMPEGIYNSNSLLVETERQMMSCGQEVMIVADHTKFGRLALARLCGLEEIDQLRRRLGPDRRAPWHLEAAGVAIHVAPVAENRNQREHRTTRPVRTDNVEDPGMSTLGHTDASRSRPWSADHPAKQIANRPSANGNGRTAGHRSPRWS